MTANPVLIRRATQDDVDGVLRLERMIPTAPHWPAAAYLGAVAEPERRLLIAERGRALLGFAAASMAGDEGELETIAVREDTRGQGLGAALVAQLLLWFSGRGGRIMRLEVRAGSVAAQRLYGRLGFVVVGLRRSYYHAPEDDAVVMQWERTGDGAV